MSLALQFLSGKKEGVRFVLPVVGEIILGRAAEATLVLDEDMVSRRHARILMGSPAPTIEDLGSTNGTFVNGEKVARSRIMEGDRILIGTSILKVVAADPLKPSSDATPPDGALSGDLADLELTDLLLLFGAAKRSGVLFVNGSSVARVYFREGEIFYAVLGEEHQLGPMKSLSRLATWRAGAYRFEENAELEEFMLELEDTTQQLVSLLLRESKELAELSSRAPGPQTVLEVNRPLPGPLSQLEQMELEVLQLAWDHGDVQTILDTSPASDLETTRAMLNLIRRGFLQRGGRSPTVT